MKYDVIIIGAGPAGYVAAVRAGQIGLKTLVVDKKYIGGMCLNWGCIPTKAILESAKWFRRLTEAADFGIDGIDHTKLSFNWSKAVKHAFGVVARMSHDIELLWKKHGVEFLKGEATVISNHEVEVNNRVLDADHIILATGSRPAPILNFPANKVLELELLYLQTELPERPVIYGQGATVAELAQFFAMIGKRATVVATDRPILPGFDVYLNLYLLKKLEKLQVPVHFAENISLVADNKIKAGEAVIEFDRVINCSWRQAVLPTMNIALDLEDGYLKVNHLMQTSVPIIYATGDINGKSYLAHAASAQAMSAINHIKGIVQPVNFKHLPLNVYTEPEIAQVGLTEEEIRSREIPYKVSELPLSSNGKALLEGMTEGVVRILHEIKYGEVLGVQIIAPNATDMISEAAVLMQMEGTVFDLAKTVHAHPTMSEVFMEAGIAGSNATELW